MKTHGGLALLVLVLSIVTAHGELVFYSWWDTRFDKPGLHSEVGGGYTRDVRLPDEEEIHELTSDVTFRTNREMARTLVLPKGSAVEDPNAFTARSQSDFGSNHAETRTLPTSYGETQGGVYFDSRSHSMYAESFWVDEWTFSGPGVGSASVTLTAGLDVGISSSPCGSSDCGAVSNPLFTRQGLRKWWYRLNGSIRVFDREVIDQLYQPDRDWFIDVPHEVGAFDVFQQGSNIDADSFGALEPYPEVRNARLEPIHATGSATFVPVAGHRYTVVGRIHIQSREGADVDASHTLSLGQVLLGPGLRLNSVASADGADFKILSSTRLSASKSDAGEVTLSFPTVAGFTYFVEFHNGLDMSDWSILGSRPGDGSPQSLADSDGGQSTRFYRLRIE